ncbi:MULTISPECIES: hypothetical protein [unclassified Roseateles]|uniref:hypothetical protein n=1 Tax=unclassified Roseateles TaxID=2626991 RepID=UPI0015877234|nr:MULTISPECIES: hypothetical protein [unclassified Roseateles]MBB3282795.1 hypothetical protein [Mitsuaria sp. BK037]
MTPLRATTGSLDTELVTGPPPTGSMSQLAGRGQRIFPDLARRHRRFPSLRATSHMTFV